MNYLGSKKTLKDFIINNILSTSSGRRTFMDVMAGTGIISREIRKYFEFSIVNDIEYYSYVLNKHYIESIGSDFNVDILNEVEPIEGIIYKNYCSPANRFYFTDENGKKIDGIRQYIEKIEEKEDYYYALTCLLEAIDKIQNTTGQYSAFLKHFKKSAEQPLYIKPVENIKKLNYNIVKNMDANELIKLYKGYKGDILYIDPPYNRRQYGANYHLLNTIAKYEMPENITRITGLNTAYYKSPFCYKQTAKNKMTELIKNAGFEDIYISYNSEGILTLEDFHSISPEMEYFQIPYKRYKSSKLNTNKNQLYEYLIHIKK